MRRRWLGLALVAATQTAHCGLIHRSRVQLFCHRTANADLPENTLESLAYAARMGCDVVEIDLTRTLDGQIILHHDGLLERLSNGMGVVEETYSQELALMDAGSWMGPRFGVMRIPTFEDALRVARNYGIGLYLDFKSKGIAPQVIASLEREGMLERVHFGGECGDVKAIYPGANEDAMTGVPPGATAQQIDAAHHEGKFVIASYSANHHELDLDGMKASVANGVDALFVDYPRLGAEAVGRPVEEKLAALARRADHGPATDRAAAIFEFARYDGFPTQSPLTRWLLDSDDKVSRAAAIALVTQRPPAPASSFEQALTSSAANVRKNAAWALGMLHAPAQILIPLLNDSDPRVRQETLLAMSRCEGSVASGVLLPFLSDASPLIRGAAALALARHQPEVAGSAVPEALAKDEQFIADNYAIYLKRGKPKLTQQEIDPIVLMYRGQMKIVQAGELLRNEESLKLLESQAFRSVEDYSLVAGLVAGYQLWDRAPKHPAAEIAALGSPDADIANRAEWILIKAGPAVLPAVRDALQSNDSHVRQRAIRIVAWQGDVAAVDKLHALTLSHPEDKILVGWAVDKIGTLNW